MMMRIRNLRAILLAGFLILLGSVPAIAEMTDFPKVRLRSLDKITARTMTFDARVGTTIKFGSIYIKIQSCQKPDLQETPEAASFLQIWEITPDDQSKWIFSGWMFASSPAVSAMDHPIYDVWVIDCLDDQVPKAAATEAAKENAAPAATDSSTTDGPVMNPPSAPIAP
jgi:hypothetical protein